MTDTKYLNSLINSLKKDSRFTSIQIVKRTNPLLIKTSKGKFSILVCEITDQQRRQGRPHERSIQVEIDEINIQKQNKKKGYQPVYVGYFKRKSGKIFQGYFPDKFEISKAKTRVSDFTWKDLEQNVIHFGPSFYFPRGKPWRQPVFMSKDIGFYLENMDWLHKKDNEKKEQQIRELRYIFKASLIKIPLLPKTLSSRAKGRELTDYEKSLADIYSNLSKKKTPRKLKKMERERRIKALVTSSKNTYKRDPQFSKSVLNAYENKCAICNISIGIIEASHIIPHKEKDSNNSVRNGIALCPNHHTLYDNLKLFFIDKNGEIKVNQPIVIYLRELKLDSFLDKTLKELKNGYRLPKNKNLAPSEAYIEISKKYRLHPN